MSSVIPGLGYPGGRTGYASQGNSLFFGSHSSNEKKALDNTFGGGVAGQPTPGMYSNLGYPGGRTGYASQGNSLFFGSRGLGQAASSNLVLTATGVIVASVFISHFSTRKKLTGIGPLDGVITGASKVLSPVTDAVKDAASAIPVIGKPSVKGLEQVAKDTF